MYYVIYAEDSIRKRVHKAVGRHLPASLIDKFDFIESALTHLVICAILLVPIVLIKVISPELIPFGLFEFWTLDTFDMKVVYASWPLFAWGVGFTALVAVMTRNDAHDNRNAEKFLYKGFSISLSAGLFEEIVFRWLLFYLAIPIVLMLNVLTFGLWQFAYEIFLAPVANFFTLGKLEHLLYNGYGWAVGSAVIFSNSRFRDGHRYQGLLGWVNSWFCGMFFFLIMFDHGLPMAILVHFLYNLFIFFVNYVDAAIERALGWC